MAKLKTKIKKSKPLFTLRANHPLSLASLAGAMFGFALILVAILIGTSNVLAFLSIEGFMIVVRTLGAAVMR